MRAETGIKVSTLFGLMVYRNAGEDLWARNGVTFPSLGSDYDVIDAYSRACIYMYVHRSDRTVVYQVLAVNMRYFITGTLAAILFDIIYTSIAQPSV